MKQLFTILTFVIFTTAAIAQSPTPKFSCTTGEMSDKQYAKHPELLSVRDQLDSFTAQYVQAHQGENQRSNGISYIIPVVFHIIHAGGAENVPDSLIYIEMQHWNQYMSMTNPELPQTAPSFTSILGNPQVEFRLAQRDPYGNCTNGIEHIYSQSTFFGDDQSKLDPWPPNQYLNVWLEKSIDKDTSAYGILAYAYYPPSVSTYTDQSIIDGIIAKYFCVGGNVDFSRPTLGHECGHWMNLEHTWGNNNTPDLGICGDDGVYDTPITQGNVNTSPGQPDPINEARCVPGVIENVQNIMNYAEQHFMFTQGQVDRMHAALNSTVAGRSNTWSQANLIATGTDQPLTYPNPNSCAAPIADFAVNNRFVCAGQNVTFQDVSYNAEYQNRQWTFPADGSITSSTDPVPTVSFSTPGWKQVTLQVSNANGSSQKVKSMVFVSSGNPVVAPYIETFEDTSEVNANWTVLNYDNNNTFFQESGPGHHSNGSYRLNEYDGTYAGDKDELVSPMVDLSDLSGSDATLTFDYSFATFDATHLYDSIASIGVLVSSDCGNTWRQLYFNEAAYQTFNAGIFTTGPFVPEITDDYWKTVTINIPSNLLQSVVNFKFQLLSAYQANHFYIDNINIGQAINTTGVGNVKVSAVNSLNIIPNPASGPATIILDASIAANITVALYDMTGREITTIYQGQVEAGGRKIAFDTDNISSGVYLVKVSDGMSTIQKRFVKM